MSLSTYAELQTAVDNWMGERGDLSAEIVDFIALAESRMWKELRIRAMVGRSTAAVSTQYLTLPTDFIAQRTIKIGDNVLDFMTPDRMERAAISDTAGTPKAYTIIGDEFQFAPSPDTEYTVEIGYYKRLDALSGSNTSNWILTNAPELYLYGALLEASPFLGNDDKIAVWGAGYARAKEALNRSEEEGRFGTAPVIWSEQSD